MSASKGIWNLSSRVHHLNHFPSGQVECFVKRDDELGCGISGSKLRKYAGLIPFFIEENIRHVIIIAGPQSNNLLAALQVCREHNLEVTAFLIKPWKLEVKGNFKLSQLFLEENQIIWINRDEWSQVELKAQEYQSNLNTKSFILTEGASVSESLVGAMSLADDIIENERSLGFQFQHIFVDAGTGFSAAALIAGLAKYNHQGMVHVLLLADDEVIFQQKLKQWVGHQTVGYECFYPTTAKAFGSCNSAIKTEIKRLAREEGILADPIYAAKLFHESRKYIENNDLKGKVLIIHSGGTLTLAGFEI